MLHSVDCYIATYILLDTEEEGTIILQNAGNNQSTQHNKSRELQDHLSDHLRSTMDCCLDITDRDVHLYHKRAVECCNLQ